MEKSKIVTLLSSEKAVSEVEIRGWVRTRRDSKTFSFIEVNDGTCLSGIQVIAEDNLDNYEQVKRLTTGSAIAVSGELRHSPGKGQKWEILAKQVHIYQFAPETYPLQKKRHTDEFLRTISHLRPRTNKYGAVFRIRSELAHETHRFFHDNHFMYIHTPILTGSDCEGAGELFCVTTLDPDNIKEACQNNYEKDFFGRKTHLTVSGQLEAEMFSLAFGDVYTFGPTFRAEKSHTSRHASEFWMVEPEMAFCNLDENMAFAEKFIRHLISHAQTRLTEDIGLFSRFVDPTLPETFDTIINKPFIRVPYKEAVDILVKSGRKFDYEISYGKDLQTEHERFLAETHFKQPVIIHDYPRNIKPFYMRLNDDETTVAAMDVIVPRIGEIIGGSQREERPDILDMRMAETGMDLSEYWWYRDSRKYGSVPHSGFGLGFERLLMLVTGITNIRDVIPFPRTPGNIEF